MFNIGINLYAIFLLSGLLLNIVIVARETYRYKMPSYEVFGLLFMENFGIFTGAKVLAFLQNVDNGFIKAGFSSYGGLIGGMLGVILFGILTKENIKQLICLTFMPIPLIYAMGKLGCFAAGCCYGISYSGRGSVVYRCSNIAPNDVSLFPVQLLEAVVFIVVFIGTYFYYKRRPFNLTTVYVLLVICTTAKFLMYYLRNESVNNLFSSHQVICISLITVSTMIFTITRLTKKKGIKYVLQ